MLNITWDSGLIKVLEYCNAICVETINMSVFRNVKWFGYLYSIKNNWEGQKFTKGILFSYKLADIIEMVIY